MHRTEFIPSEWLERSAWAAYCGGTPLHVFSRPVEIERRQVTRRHEDRVQAALAQLKPEPESFLSLDLEHAEA